MGICNLFVFYRLKDIRKVRTGLARCHINAMRDNLEPLFSAERDDHVSTLFLGRRPNLFEKPDLLPSDDLGVHDGNGCLELVNYLAVVAAVLD